MGAALRCEPLHSLASLFLSFEWDPSAMVRRHTVDRQPVERRGVVPLGWIRLNAAHDQGLASVRAAHPERRWL